MKPPYAIGSVPSLSGHAIAYRWRSLPRVRRHRASKPQGSSERVLPWQITMDQLIFASLSHTHYWCEVGMLLGINHDDMMTADFMYADVLYILCYVCACMHHTFVFFVLPTNTTIELFNRTFPHKKIKNKNKNAQQVEND